MKRLVQPVQAGVAVPAVTGLEADTTYYVENAGRTPVYLDKGSGAGPTDPKRSDGIELLPGNTWNRRVTEQEWKPRESAQFKLESGESLYAWSYEFEEPIQIQVVP